MADVWGFSTADSNWKPKPLKEMLMEGVLRSAIYAEALQAIVDADPAALDAQRIASKALGDTDEYVNTGRVACQPPSCVDALPSQPTDDRHIIEVIRGVLDRVDADAKELADAGNDLGYGDNDGRAVEVYQAIKDRLAPTDDRGLEITDEVVEIVANEIWPLDDLSSDGARDELRRDVRRGLRAALNPSSPDKESE